MPVFKSDSIRIISKIESVSSIKTAISSRTRDLRPKTKVKNLQKMYISVPTKISKIGSKTLNISPGESLIAFRRIKIIKGLRCKVCKKNRLKMEWHLKSIIKKDSGNDIRVLECWNCHKFIWTLF